MEVNELELVSHLFLLGDLVGSFDDLSRQCGLLVFILLNQSPFLSVLFLKEFFDPFSLYVSCPTILSAHQDLSLEIVGVFSNLGDGHVCFFQDGSERF